MGNWRTVNITGSMSAADVAALRGLLDERDGTRWRDVPDDAYCLAFDTRHPGLCGLGAWPAEQMNRAGNLHERDYTVEDVATALRALLAYAPTMLLKVHCGGERESEQCVATISVGEGLVVVGPPERETIDGPSAEQMHANLLTNLYGS